MNIKEIKLAAAMATRFLALSKEIKTTKHGEHEYVDAGKSLEPCAVPRLI